MSEKALQRRIKQHIKAKPHSYFAICQPGFEELLEEELRDLGVENILHKEVGGIEFEDKLAACYKINLASHIAARLIMRISTFKVIYFEKLAAKVSEIPWELYLKKNINLKISVKCHHSRLYHTGRIEQEVRDAIQQRLAQTDCLVSEVSDAEQTIFVRFSDDVCTLSLDTSGEPLYRRGYKTYVNDAPLRETHAAAILKAANVVNYEQIADVMSGSGTFSIEAALFKHNILPGASRKFAFENWPVYSEGTFNFIKKELTDKVSEIAHDKISITASDIDPEAIKIIKQNISENSFEDYITLLNKDFFELSANDFNPEKILLVMNPPYGKRLLGDEKIADFFRRLGNKIKKDFSQAGYAIIVPGIELEKVLGLPYDRKLLFMNGGIKVAVLIKY